ncbi:MAG: epoxide hydrolase [Alphaproteobacteria bacterium TMED93]|nr:MAG: epoxide hydrolase [Alphaproteobacteria bacterium TMED93]|tara:strand:+ start:146 stop:1297 length:1152 start_codon:yes stop_codon:yes gene_type:complete
MKNIKIKIKKKNIVRILKKVSKFDWDKIPDINNWSLGVDKKEFRKICDYWISKYNWKNEEKKLNKFNHYIAKVNDLNIHFIYKKSENKNSIPLLISHGWPGSFLEFGKIIGPLTNPIKYGLDSKVSFDLIIPSIPGFAFSDAPPMPLGPRKIAAYYNDLMINVLKYKSYMAQGGDWGGAISTWLGFDHSKFCKAIHLNIMIMRDKNGPQTEKEKKWQNEFKRDQILEEGYRSIQATKPQTLAFSMNDNPIGVAAWIFEKFHGWSDLKNKSIYDIYSKDELLTNIMIYLVTNSFNTATWIYYGRREEGGRVMNIEGKVNTPTACAVFPKEFLSWPPKTYVKRLYNILQWSNMPSGGHFAAMEEPDLLVKDIFNFGKKTKELFII